jgi:hypothetical protein
MRVDGAPCYAEILRSDADEGQLVVIDDRILADGDVDLDWRALDCSPTGV